MLLPKSNVIYLELEDEQLYNTRSVGNRAKIKLYCLMKGETEEEANELLKLVKEDIDRIIE